MSESKNEHKYQPKGKFVSENIRKKISKLDEEELKRAQNEKHANEEIVAAQEKHVIELATELAKDRLKEGPLVGSPPKKNEKSIPPLTHPTKDRPKKPSKRKQLQNPTSGGQTDVTKEKPSTAVDDNSVMVSSPTITNITVGKPVSVEQQIENVVLEKAIDKSTTSTAVENAKAKHPEINLLFKLKQAVADAEEKYRVHYGDNSKHQRGPRGLFSFFRHGTYGLKTAETFFNNSKNWENSATAINELDIKLSSAQTRYHRHSFGSYLLDEIKTVLTELKSDINLGEISADSVRNIYAIDAFNVSVAWKYAFEELKKLNPDANNQVLSSTI